MIEPQYRKKYMNKIHENPILQLEKDERIYFNTTYQTSGFAKAVNCKYDKKTKLWYTGPNNTFLSELVELYGISEITSERAIISVKEKLNK